MRVGLEDISYAKNTNPPRLRFRFNITNDQAKKGRYFNFIGEIFYYLEQEDEYVGDASILLGNLIDTERAVLDIEPRMSQIISMDFVLDPLVKNVIEEHRNGNLKIRLYLRCHRFEVDAEGNMIGLYRDDGSIFGPRGTTYVEIPRSQWTDILSEAGYDKHQLIEIPIDYQEILSSTASFENGGFGNRLQRATEQLTLILKHMADGDWRKAVADCRVSLEALTKGEITVDGNKESAKRVITQTLVSASIPEKNAQSFNELIERLKDYSSIQHHVKSTAGEDIELPAPMSREDALFVVSTTTTIINLLSRKYRRQTS
jgi:hypothetical protein